jgi:predicted ATPase
MEQIGDRASALRERDAERAAIQSAFESAIAGAGRVLLIEGSPGVGKTTLLDALCHAASGRAMVLRGRSGEQESDLPLAVVRELFEAAVLRADDDERVRLLTGAAGFAGRLVGANAPIATDTDSAFAMVHGLYWLTANFAEASPLVLAIDDAHWADEATQRWLAYLIPRVHELPVLLALTVRPRELAPESRLAAALATDQVMLIKPSPLTGDGTRGMLEDLLVNADAAFSGAIHRATGGNPLLVRILATALIEAAVEPTTRNVERIEALGATRVGSGAPPPAPTRAPAAGLGTGRRSLG